jgi:phosphatidylinositol alpha-mannosyltransferase
VKERNLREVHFFGRKSEEELKRYYVTADIYCSPALYGESFGIVLLEAMASGTPVTGFANKGYFQLLQGKKGERFLAPPGNVEELAKRIDELVSNEALRKEMGQWGVEVAQNYSWDKVAQRVLDVYEDVLALPGSSG